jgi:hypothetical protein
LIFKPKEAVLLCQPSVPLLQAGVFLLFHAALIHQLMSLILQLLNLLVLLAFDILLLLAISRPISVVYVIGVVASLVVLAVVNGGVVLKIIEPV